MVYFVLPAFSQLATHLMLNLKRCRLLLSSVPD